MFEQILDRFARLERSRRCWRFVSLALAFLFVVSMTVAGIVVLYLREVALVQAHRAERIERRAREVADQAQREAAVAREREEQARRQAEQAERALREARADP